MYNSRERSTGRSASLTGEQALHLVHRNLCLNHKYIYAIVMEQTAGQAAHRNLTEPDSLHVNKGFSVVTLVCVMECLEPKRSKVG